MATQQDAAPASTGDDGRVRERGWAPVRHFTERSVLGLIVVVLIGVGFGVLLLLVRFHWAPLQRLDANADDRLNALVAPHPGLVAALQTVAGLGGRGFLIPLVTVAVVVLLIRRRQRLAIYLIVTCIGALLL